jgi:hypothetical protein
MRVLSIVLLALSWSVPSLAAKNFRCKGIEGPQFKEVVVFKSNPPTLESLLVEVNPDGSRRSEDRTFFLSADMACGQAIDWTDCAPVENEGRAGYSFSFQCQRSKINGMFRIDNYNMGRFLCNGKIVLQATDCTAF